MQVVGTNAAHLCSQALKPQSRHPAASHRTDTCLRIQPKRSYRFGATQPFNNSAARYDIGCVPARLPANNCPPGDAVRSCTLLFGLGGGSHHCLSLWAQLLRLVLLLLQDLSNLPVDWIIAACVRVSPENFRLSVT